MSSPVYMGDESVPLWKPSKMIHQGAEATVFSGLLDGGERLVFKKRNHRRTYRHPDLDRRLTRQRLSVEVRVLTKIAFNYSFISLTYLT